MSVKLLVFTKHGKRKEFTVKQGVTRVGRGTDVQIRIPLERISRNHAEIKLAKGLLTVRDLKSSNGTLVNGQPVSEAPLRAGDHLGIGPVTFIVQIDGEPANPKPVISRVDGAAGAGGGEIELSGSQPDIAFSRSDPSATRDLDPIAALEALARQGGREDDPFKKL